MSGRGHAHFGLRALKSARTQELGNDGLTEAERLESLIAFRAGVGRRPELTDDLRAKFEVIGEKLTGTHHWSRSHKR